MSKDEALELALEALEVYWGKAEHRRTKEDESKAVEAITAIKEALAKDEKGLFIDLIAQHEGLAEELAQDEQSSSQEPVAWEQFYPDIGKPQLGQEPVATMKMLHTYGDTTPPERPWIGLTEANMKVLIEQARVVPKQSPCPDYNARLLMLTNAVLKELNT